MTIEVEHPRAKGSLMNSVSAINTVYAKVPSMMGHSGDEKKRRFATAVGNDVVSDAKGKVAKEERLKTGILKFASRRITHDVNNPADEKDDGLDEEDEKGSISNNAAPSLAENSKQSSVSDGIKSLFPQNESAHAASTSQQEPVPIVLISDPGQDLDDEMMFIMASHLHSLGLISIRGVVANLHPSSARARLARGTLNLLGLHHVPVGIGTDGGDTSMMHSSAQFEATSSSYIIKEEDEVAMRGLENGQLLLQRLYQAAPDIEYVDTDTVEEEGTNNGKSKTYKRETQGGLTIVVTSSFKDMSIFVRNNPTAFASKTREVVVMGGCKPILSSDSDDYYECCEPDSANNNTFDPQASDHFYSTCQQMNITLTVVSRHSAYAAKMPRSVYDDLASTGSPIGLRLRISQRAGIDQLWRRANSNDPGVREGLPTRCDRRWFIDTFCGGNDIPSKMGEGPIWDSVTGFMQYDTIALLASIPGVREVLFDPTVLPPLCSEVIVWGGKNNGTGNLRAFDVGTRNLIGISEKEHGLKAPSLLVQFLKTGYRRGLLCNHGCC